MNIGRAPGPILGVALLLGVGGTTVVPATPAWSETAWVTGAPLNLRSGAGTDFRITAQLPPDSRVEVVTQADGWTQVRTDEGKVGWIAAGFLKAQAPPRARLAQLERETTELRERMETTSSEAQQLEREYAEVSGRDEQQRTELERLTRENMKLRVGERWAEWLTGALILSLGMAAGAILRGIASRRRASRLRL
jgi:SH3 domain protein